jgi:hypothetical protein
MAIADGALVLDLALAWPEVPRSLPWHIRLDGTLACLRGLAGRCGLRSGDLIAVVNEAEGRKGGPGASPSVTNQATTAPGNGRRTATRSDTASLRSAVTRPNPTSSDETGDSGHAKIPVDGHVGSRPVDSGSPFIRTRPLRVGPAAGVPPGPVSVAVMTPEPWARRGL